MTPAAGTSNTQCANTAFVGKSLSVATIREPTFAASVTVLSTDVELGLSTVTSAVVAALPSASAWAAAHPTGLELTISDRTGQAASHNITFTLYGTDTFRGAVSPKVNIGLGLLKLRPAGSPITGWYIRGR
jgi:hypothetical protein